MKGPGRTSRLWGLLMVLAVSAAGTAACGDDERAGPTTTAPPSCTTSAPTTELPTTEPPTTRPTTTATPTTGPPTTAPATTAPATSPPTTGPLPPTTAPPPPPAGPAVVLRSGDRSRPEVALTFDAGSDAGATEDILRILAERGIHASFGLTGCWVERYPHLARQVVDADHETVNHTQDHYSFTGYSTGDPPLASAERVDQITRAESVIRQVTGADPRPWFRPPYGDYDDSVLRDAATAGYAYAVMWSVDSLGWKGLDPTAVTERTLAGAEPGAILLFHVGAASTDARALPAILDGLAARGLRPVTLSELVR